MQRENRDFSTQCVKKRYTFLLTAERLITLRIDMRLFLAGVCTLFTLLYNEVILASPWFTGPLLAPAGLTAPNGHTNLEIYGFHAINNGLYNNRGHLVHNPTNSSSTLNPVFTHGITDDMDVQLSVPYLYNRDHGANSHHMGDIAATLGYQLLKQKTSTWRPNIRFTLQEIIPIGSFNGLDPADNNTDSTGLGSYQTAATLIFQHLAELNAIHYFRTRFSITYVAAGPVQLSGLSTYGGTPKTFGRIKPGNLWAADFAGELTLTQNWVAVMETYIARRQASHFTGFIGNKANGTPGSIGHNTVDLYTLAPAIEYNFNENIGLIGGAWFIVGGHNTTHFMSYVLALNAFW